MRLNWPPKHWSVGSNLLVRRNISEIELIFCGPVIYSSLEGAVKLKYAPFCSS